MAEKQIEAIAKSVKRITVVEMNMGQYLLEVERILGKYTEVKGYGRTNGELITPNEIVSFVEEG